MPWCNHRGKQHILTLEGSLKSVNMIIITIIITIIIISNLYITCKITPLFLLLLLLSTLTTALPRQMLILMLKMRMITATTSFLLLVLFLFPPHLTKAVSMAVPGCRAHRTIPPASDKPWAAAVRKSSFWPGWLNVTKRWHHSHRDTDSL